MWSGWRSSAAFYFMANVKLRSCAVKRPAAGLSCLPLFAQRGAVALSLYLLIDASRRIYDLGPCSGTPGDLAVPTTPTKKVMQSRPANLQRKEPAEPQLAKSSLACRTKIAFSLPLRSRY